MWAGVEVTSVFQFLVILPVFKYPERQLFYSAPPPSPADDIDVIETVTADHTSFQVFFKGPENCNKQKSLF